MDLLGVVILALVTAVGGGTVRDVLLGSTPPFCFKDENYLYLSIVVALLVFYYHRSLDFMHRPLPYLDALGLGTFLVIGTGKALSYDAGFLVAVMMGVTTATAGGVVRDVLSDQVPFILQKEIYATACIVGGILYWILYQFGMNESLIAVIAALVVVIIRVIAIHKHWSLPLAKID
jgi:uncharacterized membrane protein YeiH